MISLQASNQDLFRLSDHEYVYLTTSGLRLGLDWMPDGDNGYVSGEPPDTELDEDEEISDDLPPESVSASRVAKLAQLVAVLLEEIGQTTNSSSAEKAISSPRLQALAGWLQDAKDVRLIVS